MISRNPVRQSLKTLAPALFLLLCCSISAFAQSPSEPQEPKKKDLAKVTFNSPVKSAISTLGMQVGLNIVFDDQVKNERLTIDLNDVTIEQALEIILVAKNLQARIIEEKTIIIAPDNETCRYFYKQYKLWTAKSDGDK